MKPSRTYELTLPRLGIASSILLITGDRPQHQANGFMAFRMSRADAASMLIEARTLGTVTNLSAERQRFSSSFGKYHD